MNIGDWIRKWISNQPYKKALIFEERLKTASGKIQEFFERDDLRTGGLNSEAPACAKPRCPERTQGSRHSDFECELRGQA
jgi:hypothetical protein